MEPWAVTVLVPVALIIGCLFLLIKMVNITPPPSQESYYCNRCGRFSNGRECRVCKGR